MGINELTQKSEGLLKENFEEWPARWELWADGLLDNKEKIISANKTFNEHPPLRSYMPIGEAKKSKNQCKFALRYYGKDVAEIQVNFSDMKPRLYFENKENDYKKSNRDKLGLEFTEEVFDNPWDSKPSAKFRSEIKSISIPAHDEHLLESMILDEMEKKTSDKFEGTLRNIQPVRLYDKLRFQMKIPFSANDGTPKYSPSGGGIDILARIGSGINTNLAVLELKKDNKASYKKAISQSIVYSVGILNLLRSGKCGEKWWELFGYSRDLPESLDFYAGVMVPVNLKQEYENEKKNLDLEDDTVIKIGNDRIKCGYIFFDVNENDRIEIKEVGGGFENLIFEQK